MPEKQLGHAKTMRNPIPIIPVDKRLPKPSWIRAKAPVDPRYFELKSMLRELNLHTVCEEASCPNIGECFGRGTASFMILGDICTRRCPFCDVAHGRPEPPDPNEPDNLGKAIATLGLRYVVITSVDRDDLRDGGAQHFVDCIAAVRKHAPKTTVEVLVPDFRGRHDRALNIIGAGPPDVFNHNLETIERLYREVRPGASYDHSLDLLQEAKQRYPDMITKSGLMVGVGETDEEIEQVMHDLREHDVDMLTIGQYLQPSQGHLPVKRYVEPNQFERFEKTALKMGFANAACGAMVRSSYEADRQAENLD